MKTFWAVFLAILAAAVVIALAIAGLRLASEVANAPSGITVNQEFVVGSLRTIATAEVTYASTYAGTYSPDLPSLGPGRCLAPASSCAGLVDEVLASGKKSGYVLHYVPGPKDRRGKITRYTITARPEVYGKTGMRSFFVDETGVIRATPANREPAASDTPII